MTCLASSARAGKHRTDRRQIMTATIGRIDDANTIDLAAAKGLVPRIYQHFLSKCQTATAGFSGWKDRAWARQPRWARRTPLPPPAGNVSFPLLRSSMPGLRAVRATMASLISMPASPNSKKLGHPRSGNIHAWLVTHPENSGSKTEGTP